MSRKKRVEIVVPILNDEYKVIVCFGEPSDIKKTLFKWFHKPADSSIVDLQHRRGCCFYAPDCHPVIALPHFPKTGEEIGTLSHEAVHAVSDIFKKIEENDVNEVFAHSVGAVVRTVLKSK
jgi:hypothetical protein